MNKFNFKNLELAPEDLLQREHLKTVVGGAMHEDGCRVAVRNADGTFLGWSQNTMSYEAASGAYNNQLTYEDGSYVSGYCCANC